MKVLKYNLCTLVNHGTEDAPLWEEILCPVVMGWNKVNEETAKREAHNGEYTIDDDGEEENTEPTQEERIAELEEALELLLAGGTE